MIGRWRHEVARLAVREREARVRRTLAKARLERVKARFLANPVNLLLPFTAGALGGALALYRKPPGVTGRRRTGFSPVSATKTVATLWGLSLPLREALLDARAAAIADAASGTDAGDGREDERRVARRDTPSDRQPAPRPAPPATPPAAPPA